MKKNLLPTLFLLFLAQRVAAQDEAWFLQGGVTPQTLSSTGALLTDTDSMAWPDGRSVFVTYWLGVNDVIFRCAELRDGEATSPSCWQREFVAESVAAPGVRVVRSISTRRRPLPYLTPYHQSYAPNPRVWVGVRR